MRSRPSWCKCRRGKVCAAHLTRMATLESAVAREERTQPSPEVSVDDDVIVYAGRPPLPPAGTDSWDYARGRYPRGQAPVIDRGVHNNWKA